MPDGMKPDLGTPQEYVNTLTLLKRVEALLENISGKMNQNRDVAIYRTHVDAILSDVKKACEKGMAELARIPECRSGVPRVGNFDPAKRTRKW